MPRLGIVLLDLPHYSATSGRFEPQDPRGLGTLAEGAFECPATWRWPTDYEVARGANVDATLAGTPAAVEGVRAAVRALAGRCDLIIGDCGFFWAAGRQAPLTGGAPAFLSGLDLIEPVAARTTGKIGVLTYSEADLDKMLAEHRLRSRLCLAGLSEQASWARLGTDDYGLRLDWERSDLEAELDAVLARLLTPGGRFHGVRALVLECTLIPQFRNAIRRHTTVPVLDLASFADAQLRAAPSPALTDTQRLERTTDAQ